MISSFRTYVPLLLGLLFLLPSGTSAATLDPSPLNTTVTAGSTFTETVYVTSSDQALNAVSGALSFPSELLQVVSVSKVGSALSLWIQEPTFSNVDGTISFSGIVPNPGYTGRGKVFSVQFRAKNTGSASLVFSPASQVLANDGNGTDILHSTGSASITIRGASTPVSAPVAPVASPTKSGTGGVLAHITSSTHPDQTAWYNLPHVVFDWTNEQKTSAVRLGYDESADSSPVVVYTDPISHKELDLEDGISYFHVQERGVSGWGPVSSYRVQIDTAPPAPFEVLFPQGTTTQVGTPITTVFMATDALSGIDHYQVAVDGNEFTVTADEGSRPYTVTAGIGAHMLLVRAYDKAGNSTLSNKRFFVAGQIVPPPFNFFTFGWLAINYISIVLIGIAVCMMLLFSVWYLRMRFMAYMERFKQRLGLTHAYVHEEFDSLKEAITQELLTLEDEKSKRALTREEERIVARFKNVVRQSEQQSVQVQAGKTIEGKYQDSTSSSQSQEHPARIIAIQFYKDSARA